MIPENPLDDLDDFSDEDLSDPQKNVMLRRRLEREEAAAKGDFEHIWQAFLDAKPRSEHLPTFHKLLMQALDVRSKNDPNGFLQSTIRQLSAFSVNLAMRVQLDIQTELMVADLTMYSSHSLRLPPGLLDRLVPAFISLIKSVAEIGLVQAQISRQLELTRGAKLRNDALSREMGTREKPPARASKHKRSKPDTGKQSAKIFRADGPQPAKSSKANASPDRKRKASTGISNGRKAS